MERTLPFGDCCLYCHKPLPPTKVRRRPNGRRVWGGRRRVYCENGGLCRQRHRRALKRELDRASRS